MNGYKKAIRNRMPETWVFVLKYLGKLGAWIDLVYGTKIRPINNRRNRKGIKESKKKALHKLFARPFCCSLDPCLMSYGEYKSWYEIWRRIAWTSKHYLFVCDIYDKLRTHDGLSYNQAIGEICRIFKLDVKFANALINRYCKDMYED